MRKTGIAWALGMALALVGCGGGSDDPVATVPLSTTNYDTIATDIVLTIGGAGPIFSVVESPLSAAATGSSPYAALATGQMGPIAALGLKQIGAANTQLESPQAVYNDAISCPVSGTLAVSFDDADNDNEVSSGDTLTITATSCVFEPDQPAVNGTLAYRFNSVVLDAYGYVVSASLSLTFTGFSVGDVTLNGSATISANASSVTLDYNKLTATRGGQTLVYDYTLMETASGLTVDGNLSINGSTYGLSTPQVVTWGYGYPNSGQVKITDGRGAYVITTFQADGYVHRLYLAGDDVVDATSPLHPWIVN